MENTSNPLLVVGIKGQQYVYEVAEPLEYSLYKEIKAVAEHLEYYASNARCVNPDVLAYQFTTRVKENFGIVLKKCDTWPQIVVKFKNSDEQ